MHAPISQKRLENQISVAESLDNFVKQNKIEKSHFLYNYLNTVIFCASRLCHQHPEIKPNNLDKLMILQSKYYNLRQKIRTLLNKY